MKRRSERQSTVARAEPATSPVKAMLAWLVEADREFRVAQSMVDKFHRRF